MNDNYMELFKIRQNVVKYVQEKQLKGERVSEPILRYVNEVTDKIQVSISEAVAELHVLQEYDEDFAFLGNNTFNNELSKANKWVDYFKDKQLAKVKTRKKRIPKILREED